jgi:predicted XRE-type DNA-binding protein
VKSKSKVIKVKTATELADALGLSAEDGIEIELRSELNAKIIEVVKKKRLTHLQVAKQAKTSRTRMTALLNCNTKNISTSLMIRVLAALGIRAKISFSVIRDAA